MVLRHTPSQSRNERAENDFFSRRSSCGETFRLRLAPTFGSTIHSIQVKIPRTPPYFPNAVNHSPHRAGLSRSCRHPNSLVTTTINITLWYHIYCDRLYLEMLHSHLQRLDKRRPTTQDSRRRRRGTKERRRTRTGGDKNNKVHVCVGSSRVSERGGGRGNTDSWESFAPVTTVSCSRYLCLYSRVGIYC